MMDKEKVAKYTKLGIVAAGIMLVAPFVFLLVKGIVGLAIAGVLGLAIVSFAPYVAMKFANWKVSAVKFEAGRNPIETMQNVYDDKKRALADFLQRIEEFQKEVFTFKDKLEDFKVSFPKDAAKFEETLTKMNRLLALRTSKYKASKMNLEEFWKEIEKADAIWQMSIAAAKMHKSAGLLESDFMEKIKVETSIDSVQRSLNQSLAELETSLMDEEEFQKITHEPGQVIEMEVSQKQKVAA